jgi:hypothetical protein
MMAELRYPTSDSSRLALLEAALTEIPLDESVQLPPAFVTDMQTFVTSYRPLVEKVQEERAKRGLEVTEKRTAVNQLDRYVRDFWAVLERRVIREGLNEALLLTYNLPLDGNNPKGGRMEDWLEWAAAIVKGEETAVSNGFAPMSNPSAAEVDAIRLAAIAEAADVRNADRDLDHAQHALDDVRAEADKLIRLLSGQLDMAMYGISADDVRHTKARFGFTYRDQASAVLETAVDESTPPPPDETPPL